MHCNLSIQRRIQLALRLYDGNVIVRQQSQTSAFNFFKFKHNLRLRFELTYLNLFTGTTLVRLFERAYDMSISYFQLITADRRSPSSHQAILWRPTRMSARLRVPTQPIGRDLIPTYHIVPHRTSFEFGPGKW